MDSSNSISGSDAGPSQTLNRQSLNLFGQGISLVLSRWVALQMATENQWGGQNSLQKSHKLASKILKWFSRSEEPLYIDELEEKLDEKMVHYFKAEIEDGSIEEVAEQLMVMYEECLKGNYKSIENLRMFVPGTNAVYQSRKVINDDVDESSDDETSDVVDDSSDDDEASDMMVDEPLVSKVAVEKPKLKEMPDEDGWSVVGPKRNRGKKSG